MAVSWEELDREIRAETKPKPKARRPSALQRVGQFLAAPTPSFTFGISPTAEAKRDIERLKPEREAFHAEQKKFTAIPTARQNQIRQILDEAWSTHAAGGKPGARLAGALGTLKPLEVEYASRYVQETSPMGEIDTRWSVLMAAIQALNPPLGVAGMIAGRLAKGAGPVARGATKVLGAVGKAKAAKGVVGKGARTVAAAGRSAEAMVGFHTLGTAPEVLRAPREGFEQWRAGLVPAATFGAVVGGGVHLAGEILPGMRVRPPTEGEQVIEGVRQRLEEVAEPTPAAEVAPKPRRPARMPAKAALEAKGPPVGVEPTVEAPPGLVQRVEEPGVPRATVDKPHGIYTTPAQYKSPHAELGGEISQWRTNPKAKVLTVDATELFETNRGLAGQSAGVAALRQLVGDERTSSLAKMPKGELQAVLAREFPDVEWNRYFDQAEILEGYAGLLARREGYDAIWGIDRQTPEMSEYVALTDRAMTPTTPVPTPRARVKVEPAAAGRFEHRLEPNGYTYEVVDKNTGEVYQTGIATERSARALAKRANYAPVKPEPVTTTPEAPPLTPAPATLVDKAVAEVNRAMGASEGGGIVAADVRAAASNASEQAAYNETLAKAGWQEPQVKRLWSEAKQAKEPPKLGPGVTKMYAGVSPGEAIRIADSMDLPPSPRARGGFKVERPQERAGRDYDLRDRFLQPIGIYDPAGNPIQKGVYDRLGTIVTEKGETLDLGTQAGKRMREAQRTMDAGITDAQAKINQIGELVASVAPKTLTRRTARASLDKTFSDFVDLIEKPIEDVSRQQVKTSDAPLGQALKLHDEMTDGFRRYIIESRRAAGIETPENWGITEQGYFRHLFLGDIRMFKDGKFVGTARTYSEAQKIAFDFLTAEPDANITASARNTFAGDPTVRVSTRRYFKMVSNLAEEVTLTKSEIMEDIRGIVGRKAMKRKWFGALMPRTGAPGYTKAYLDAMRIHASQMYRSQELSKMNHAVQPMIEQLRTNGKPGLAQAMEDHIKDLWGTPSTWELNFGELVKNTPVLRNYVANPALAFRGLARKLTGLQMNLKLRVSPRSALVNLLQPFSTLWPYITTEEYVALYVDFVKPSTRRMLAERDVFRGATKLETVGRRKPLGRSAILPWNWFEAASNVNRGVGYLYGYKRALREGFTEAEAHDAGLSWAEKVEFDNSVTNIQPILRSPGGRILGQFKSFMLKNLENIREVWAPEGVPRPQRVGRAGKWLGAQLGIGGVRSLGLIAKGAGSYLIAEQIKKQLQSYGMNEDEAQKWADAVYYGAPSLIGQDLSASVMILEEPYGRTPLEKAANFTFGPSVSMGLTVGSAALATARAAKGGITEEERPKLQAQLGKTARTVTPLYKPYDVLEQAWAEGIGGTTITAGGEQIELTPFEAIMRMLAFTPVKQTRYYDVREAGIKEEGASAEPWAAGKEWQGGGAWSPK